MTFDYTDASTQREFDLIPHGTLATVQMNIQPGGAGEGGILSRSKNGDCEMLKSEFTVVEGEYARRKFWERFVLAGTTDGHAKAVEISRSKLRGILESARGIKPDDTSPQARAARTVELAAFDGLRFVARIGVEKGGENSGGGNYPDRNFLLTAITPDRRDWHAVERTASPPHSSPPTAPAAVAVPKPAWAS
jgi:hypothetical protein